MTLWNDFDADDAWYCFDCDSSPCRCDCVQLDEDDFDPRDADDRWDMSDTQPASPTPSAVPTPNAEDQAP